MKTVQTNQTPRRQIFPIATLPTTNSPRIMLWLKPVIRGEKPATICLGYCIPNWNVKSVGSTETRLRTGRSRVRIPVREKRFFYSPKCSEWLWGPFSLLSMYAEIFPGDQAARRDDDHSPQSSAEVKNEWSWIPSWCGQGQPYPYIYLHSYRLIRRKLIPWKVCLTIQTLKVDSHIACRAHAVPLTCHAAKGLERVFLIWFTQCGRVWFTLAMPCPCRAHAMLWPCRSSLGHGTARPSRDGLWGICPPSASSGYHAEFHKDCYRKHTSPPHNDPYLRL